jgi:hypothetical protein
MPEATQSFTFSALSSEQKELVRKFRELRAGHSQAISPTRSAGILHALPPIVLVEDETLSGDEKALLQLIKEGREVGSVPDVESASPSAAHAVRSSNPDPGKEAAMLEPTSPDTPKGLFDQIKFKIARRMERREKRWVIQPSDQIKATTGGEIVITTASGTQNFKIADLDGVLFWPLASLPNYTDFLILRKPTKKQEPIEEIYLGTFAGTLSAPSPELEAAQKLFKGMGLN